MLGLHWAVCARKTLKEKKWLKTRQKFISPSHKSWSVVTMAFHIVKDQSSFYLVSQLFVIHGLRWFQAVVWRMDKEGHASFFIPPEISRKLLNNNFIDQSILTYLYMSARGINATETSKYNLYSWCLCAQLNFLLLWKKWKKTQE